MPAHPSSPDHLLEISNPLPNKDDLQKQQKVHLLIGFHTFWLIIIIILLANSAITNNSAMPNKLGTLPLGLFI